MRSRISFWDALWTCYDVKRVRVAGYGIEGQSNALKNRVKRKNFGKKYRREHETFFAFSPTRLVTQETRVRPGRVRVPASSPNGSEWIKSRWMRAERSGSADVRRVARAGTGV